MVAHDRSTGRDFPGLRVEHGRLGAATWCLTTRFGGASVGDFAESNLADHVGDDPRSVAANRSALAEAMGADSGLAWIQAEHSSHVVEVTAPGTVEATDGLITTRRGLGIVGLGADCAVIGISGVSVDSEPIVMVLHCGWRGLVADVVGTGVQAMRRMGLQDASAIVGPAICGKCYRVDAERVATVRMGCSPEVVRACIDETDPLGIDIGAGVRARLAELGVHVDHQFGCTYEQDRWFSLRRSTQGMVPSTRTGRHALGMIIP